MPMSWRFECLYVKSSRAVCCGFRSRANSGGFCYSSCVRRRDAGHVQLAEKGAIGLPRLKARRFKPHEGLSLLLFWGECRGQARSGGFSFNLCPTSWVQDAKTCIQEAQVPEAHVVWGFGFRVFEVVTTRLCRTSRLGCRGGSLFGVATCQVNQTALSGVFESGFR